MIIRVTSKSGNVPVYQTEGSAGADLKACLDEPITLMPGERRLIPTGLKIELPDGVEAQIRARSGLSIKHGITMINGVGTVDSDYRGEWNVPMVNLGSEPYTINDGDRIAQAVFTRYERAEFVTVDSVNDTERGGGGFGSTGK
ncbi:MAG: dUTP diphosphatase [Clostridia bacterium]|nr:dUTP diphosphatase [Clostridia bacterium]